MTNSDDRIIELTEALLHIQEEITALLRTEDGLILTSKSDMHDTLVDIHQNIGKVLKVD